ncbi:PAS/PAC sensor signal transduction histidine kinase [Calothrix parasitica NIES-267]|uniref:histidine kinase n=1 Tax=Calothrix parasitica NIES-267 TaxID=1973488 RepID=A0A1Z4LYT0_9CYAN|nr:PAS/PAC sensor signal transduction histidine kinase [Calothrix parasitica NIES-267]
MNSEYFNKILQIFPEHLILLNSEGIVIKINPALAKMLGYKSKQLENKLLYDIVNEPSNEVINYLQACSKSRQMIIGRLNFCQPDKKNLACRCEGAVVQPSSSSSPAIILIRLENRTSANNNFAQLNQQIDNKLIKEAYKRKKVESALRNSELELRQKAEDLEDALRELRRTQSKLVQSEKMSALGQTVAGVAHEINNPVSFIHGNILPANLYAQDLIRIIELYQKNYPNPVEEIEAETEAIQLDFLKKDFIELLNSMKNGTERIKEIVLSLRNFSRLDEADFKQVDIHQGIDSTLLILQNRLKSKPNHPGIEVIKRYSSLPKVDCYAGQLNQVFMNILANAIDALDSQVNKNQNFNLQIKISTELSGSNIVIRIADNGSGIPLSIQSKLFDPFFTTKEIGKGTGLGLSISYQIIVDKHQGKLSFNSSPGEGTEFIIEIPIKQY